MHLDSLAKDELIKAIAIHLQAFEWHDQHPGQYPDEATSGGFPDIAERRLRFDPMFKAKTFRMLNAIEFVLEDPGSVEHRRREQIKRIWQLSHGFAASLGIPKRQFVDDFLSCHYYGY